VNVCIIYNWYHDAVRNFGPCGLILVAMFTAVDFSTTLDGSLLV
jgi:hypothetical protein